MSEMTDCNPAYVIVETWPEEGEIWGVAKSIDSIEDVIRYSISGWGEVKELTICESKCTLKITVSRKGEKDEHYHAEYRNSFIK